jgi:formate hydrogenlyase subunit 3/multisubunit Na+/H+ antiporter MnhD subunit
LNLDEFEEERFNASVAASNQGRTLALAGLGFVWLFASDFFLKRTGAHPSGLLAASGVALALTLLLDVSQLYVRWATLEHAFNAAERAAEGRPQDDDPEFEDMTPAPRRWTVPLFHAKFACLFLGYALLAVYLAARLWR